MDKNDDHHLLRLKDTFIHRQHLCLVFELLSVNLYELIKQNQFRGLSTTLVRVFAQQLINGLALLGKAKLIHCDLKPENILLKKSVISPVVYWRISNHCAVSRAQSSRLSISDLPATSDRRFTPTFSRASTGLLKCC
jgi:serine/threonine protein kinase